MTARGCTTADHEAILGPAIIADIHARVAAAPKPSPEQVERVRRIFAPAIARLIAREKAEAANQVATPRKELTRAA